MGCSPYFAIIGTHPLLPFDIIEVNYLLPPPDSLISTTDLVARRAVALQKRQEDLVRLCDRIHKAQNRAALRFKRDHVRVIRDFNFVKGVLVLVRNTAIEKALNKKMRPRYFSPMVVVSRNRGGAYIICDLDGTLAHTLIAAFRIVPYFAREHIDLPDLEQHIDVSATQLRELEDTTVTDPDYPEIAKEPLFYERDHVNSDNADQPET
jgi:hypothetical protein